MPLRNEPPSLQRVCITVLADNWDLICYSCKSSNEMLQLLESDGYLGTEGPFVNLRKLPSNSTICSHTY